MKPKGLPAPARQARLRKGAARASVRDAMGDGRAGRVRARRHRLALEPRNQFPGTGLATAAAGCHAQLKLDVAERHSGSDAAPDLAIGDLVANTNDHGMDVKFKVLHRLNHKRESLSLKMVGRKR